MKAKFIKYVPACEQSPEFYKDTATVSLYQAALSWCT